MMWNGWGTGGWGMGFGMLFMVLFWVLLVVVAVAVIRWMLQWSDRARGPSGAENSAVEILRRRYAHGEIGREEFERMKRDLES